MNQKENKTMNIVLWILQGLLAAAFGMAGIMKITAPVEELAKNGMGFVNDYGIETVRFIGISEVLGALGLILPAALKIKPILTPIASLALSVVMILATAYHFSENEPILPSLLFLAVTLFIAWGRFKKSPILGK